MYIDLSLLHSNSTPSISIHGVYDLPKEIYENSDVVKLEPVEVEGEVRLDEEGEDYITCQIKGTMILLDSVSLEEVAYPFQIEYDDICDENCKKDEKNLDIFLFLWENIVLEIPLQFTKVRDLSKFHGDGWRLMSEDEYHFQSHQFSDLLKSYHNE